MDLFGSISHGHAGSSVSMSLKNPKLIWCVMCAQTIQVCLHRVVETLPPVHPEVGRAWQPTSLFSQNVCAIGKWGFHREKWKLRLCWDCLLSYPCELNFRDFRLFAPFFGPTHLAAVQDWLKLQITPLFLVSVHAAVGMRKWDFFFDVCWDDATKKKLAAEFLTKSSKLWSNPFE